MLQNTSKEWNDYYDFLAYWEGGLSKDQTDYAHTQRPNGDYHTNRGITWDTYKTLAPLVNISNDYNTFVNLTREQAKKISNYYFNNSSAAKFTNPAIAFLYFEIEWGSGNYAPNHLKAALKNLGYQEATNNKLAQNIILANKINQSDLYNELLKVREGFYRQIVLNDSKQKRNLDGWLNRLNSFITKFPKSNIQKKNPNNMMASANLLIKVVAVGLIITTLIKK
jgi:hypothetical protein